MESEVIDIIESLLAGNPEYPAAFRAAKAFWDDFFAVHADDPDDELRTALEGAQIPFQWKVEEVGLIQPFAKQIFLLTCVGSLYNDGFEDEGLPRRVIEAARTSSMSSEIANAADNVAQMYGLE